jgi:tellurite resistance protein TerC
VKKRLALTYRWARRIAIAIIGGTVLAVGMAMVVLPGPAMLVIPVGLGILGLEFAFARRWLKTLKEKGAYVAGRVREAARRSPPDAP